MPVFFRYLVVTLLSYLLGSINFSVIVSRLTLHKDIRDFGSGNAGFTNSYRVMGPKKGIAVFVLDLAKGVAAIALSCVIFHEFTVLGGLNKLVSGAFVILGHIYPVWFGFRGGKGVMTCFAMVLYFDYRICSILLAVFLIVFVVTRFVSLGSMISVSLFPVMTLLFYRGGENSLAYFVIGVCLAALIVFLHRENIKRLIAGNENRFRFHVKNI